MSTAELYQEVILEHNKHPKNFREIPDATLVRQGYNPLCGDRLSLFLKLDSHNLIEDVSFQGNGCAISKASASMMTQAVKGKTKEQALALFNLFHDQILGEGHQNPSPTAEKQLGKLSIFSNIWKYPARVKCASLCWHTLDAALTGGAETVKTE